MQEVRHMLMIILIVRLAAFLVLRRKEIPLSPDCLPVWVYVSKSS